MGRRPLWNIEHNNDSRSDDTSVGAARMSAYATMDSDVATQPMTVVSAGLFLLTLLLWTWLLALLSTMHDSDPAGNGLTQAFAMLFTIVLWIMLGALTLIAGIKNGLSRSAIVVAVVLIPASGVAALAAAQLLTERTYSRWPLIIPVLAPAMILFYALWVYFPRLHAAVPSRLAATIAWSMVFVLSIIPWPVFPYRARHREAHMARVQADNAMKAAKFEMEERRQKTAKFRSLTADSALWEWSDFATGENRQAALEGIRHVKRRQVEAERMIRHDLTFPMDELPNLDLQATPALCEAAQRFLDKRAKELRPPIPDMPPEFSVMAHYITPYVPAIEWLVEHHCDCGQELAALDSAARMCPDSPERRRFLDVLARLPRTPLNATRSSPLPGLPPHPR